MQRQQAQATYLQVDETPIRYLEPGAGRAPQGYFWVTHVPGSDVIYHWHASRAAACLQQVVPPAFRGTLQCDGYSGYVSHQKERAHALQLAGCWAHARRKFYEARSRAPLVVDWLLRQIGQLYSLESRLRSARASPKLRAAARAREAAPVVERIRKALIILKPRYLPQSSLGKAIAYTFGLWPQLGRYLQHGHLEIDNNLVENAIRPTAIGKKNWLFIGSEGSGQTSAILFTLVESAKRQGLEPYTYLCHLLRSLPAATNWQIHRFTPAAYAKAQAKAKAQNIAA